MFSKCITGFALLRWAIGLKFSYRSFIQSEVQPKPIVSRSLSFSHALRQFWLVH